MITKYGYTTVGIITIIVFLIIAASFFISNNYLKYGLASIGILFFLFTIYFFRDPDRVIPENSNIIVSPADGKVIIVKEINDKKFVNEDAWQISIFMSPLDVHVNRIPVSGKVDYLKYIEGDYLVAYYDKADERNERSEIGITSSFGKVFFTQVAGAVARRIVNELNEGDSVKIGERFGMIKFGSRADVIVPKFWDVKVKTGDKVYGGETILFELNK